MRWLVNALNRPETIGINFVPRQDITAHELAVVMLRTQGVVSLSRIPIDRGVWGDMDPHFKRHFEAVL